jgi:flavin reductase (DIM6/NTAB) family NADH-FMN oxidoreductase RutF
MIINESELLQLETRFRANLINSLGGFKSLVVIGTKSSENVPNLATFSSLFHLGAHPALCGIIIRPSLPKRNTLGNILEQKHYTLNHVTPAFFKEAHQCSAKYPENESEFEAVGLTPQYITGIAAPFVQESQVKFACELVQKTDITLNGTTLIIGKITQIILPENILQQDGFIDLETAETVTCSGLDSYHTTKKLGRLSYAKVGTAPQEI